MMSCFVINFMLIDIWVIVWYEFDIFVIGDLISILWLMFDICVDEDFFNLVFYIIYLVGLFVFIQNFNVVFFFSQGDNYVVRW